MMRSLVKYIAVILLVISPLISATESQAQTYAERAAELFAKKNLTVSNYLNILAQVQNKFQFEAIEQYFKTQYNPTYISDYMAVLLTFNNANAINALELMVQKRNSLSLDTYKFLSNVTSDFQVKTLRTFLKSRVNYTYIEDHLRIVFNFQDQQSIDALEILNKKGLDVYGDTLKALARYTNKLQIRALALFINEGRFNHSYRDQFIEQISRIDNQYAFEALEVLIKNGYGLDGAQINECLKYTAPAQIKLLSLLAKQKDANIANQHESIRARGRDICHSTEGRIGAIMDG